VSRGFHQNGGSSGQSSILTDWGHVAQHLCTINSDPVKRGMGENIAGKRLSRLTTVESYRHTYCSCPRTLDQNTTHEAIPIGNLPRKLLCKEVIHPSKSDELRKSTGQAETVRQPRGLATDSKPALEETLAEDELTGETFTRRHIGVVLYPRTTDRVELSFEDLGLDTLEQLWVELLEPLILLYAHHGKYGASSTERNAYLGRATREPMFGVPFHEVDLGRPRPGNLLLCGTVGLYISALGPPDNYEWGAQTQSLQISI